ncbi:MAG: LysM peptidoglycan-binding domain-containing protein [Anaerolineae bacterium]|nr:LysM peptidoglycan-binding domain-containing protein [Anaerolineae bacterium]
MQHVRQLMIALVALAVLLTTPMLVAAQGGQTTHTVQAGENLTRIALKYGTTVQAIVQANNITNPNLVFVGQVLTIPGAGITPTLQPTGTVSAPPPQPTTAPAGETIHVVQPGENLFRVALKYGLSTAFLASYNGITNPNVIYVGQRIRIPSGAAAQPQPQPATPAPVGATPLPATVAATLVPTNVPAVTMIPAATPTPGMPQNTATNVGFAYGVQLHLPNQNIPQVVQAASALEVTWVKQQIEWAIYEANAGSINWAPLDEIVNALDGAGFNILLSVGSAPGWARDSDQEKGPPTDYQTYANFIGQLAQRYKGKVDAYEVWNEQNLRREWNTPRGISAASYVELLRLAYTAIKNADSSALVVTGGLAPTGFNDGVNAIDDRVYLRQMYAAGVAEWSDAIGAHPNGWANPPDSTCCRNNRPAVPAWDDHPSFFFKQTLADYRQIMVENGDSGTFIWPTEFGWGSNDGLNVEPPPEYAFVAFTSLDEQASYILRGFQLGKELGYIGPMFLWNLNFCPVVGVTGEQCLWSLLDPAGNPRPAYLTLRDLDK